jgi:hypothetical protein
MHSINPFKLSNCLVFFSAIILVAVTSPADTNRANLKYPTHVHKAREDDLCKAGAGQTRTGKLDLTRLEESGYCHYKVCVDEYEGKSGTRNPSVIYRIICKETTNCRQAYLTVEVVTCKNGRETRRNESVPAGCIYSTRDLRNSTEATYNEPKGFE